MGLLDIGVGLATNVASGLVQKQREKDYMSNQKDLMERQKQNQMMLNQQGSDLQYDMWKKTNYKPQMEELEKAGLNPALLYGMSGGGGATTGSQSGGSAQGGNAPAPQHLDIGQNMMLNKQMNLIDAQTQKTEAEADSIRGEEGTEGESRIKKLKEEIITEGAKRELMEADKWLKRQQAATETTKASLNSEQRYDIIKKREAIIDNLNKDTMLKEINAKLQESGTELNEAKINEIWHEIRQKWIKAGNETINTIMNGVIKTKLPKGSTTSSSSYKTKNGEEKTVIKKYH